MSSMNRYDYLIVGGGIAGVGAAEEIRARDPHATILIVSKELEPLYSRVLLPLYVRSKIDRAKVFLRSFEDYERRRIDLASGEEAIGADFSKKEVVTSRHRIIKYSKLLIATGGDPKNWNIDGSTKDNTMRLQTLDDAERARSTLIRFREKKDRAAIVVGGGFIGLEFIESAAFYGFRTHLIMRENQYFGDALEERGWDLLKKNFIEHGAIVYPETEVISIEEEEVNGLIVHTNTSQKIKGSWIGMVGIGLARNLEAFRGEELETARGVLVNEFLESSVPDVWAAGDIAEYYDVILKKRQISGNWTQAVLQGKIAGTNMTVKSADERRALQTVSTYSIVNLGFQITFVGNTQMDEGMDDVVRTWPENKGYERLFFEGGLLRGVVLINRFQDKTVLGRLIENGLDLSQVKEDLADPYADIRTLV